MAGLELSSEGDAERTVSLWQELQVVDCSGDTLTL